MHIPDWLQGSDPIDNVNKSPEAIIDRRMVQQHNRAITQYLVKWCDKPTEDASWMDAQDFESTFPSFDPET